MAKLVVCEEFDLNGKLLGWSVYEGSLKRYGPCSTEKEAQKKADELEEKLEQETKETLPQVEKQPERKSTPGWSR